MSGKSCGKRKRRPGKRGSCGGKSVSVANNEQLVAEITKKVMEQLSK